jgi:predicted GIY-YIG superfamily endonuclease
MTGENLEAFQMTASSAPASSAPGTIGVYRVFCGVTGKSYIGWSTHVRNRLGWHKSHLRKGNHSRREMQADFTKHGESTFAFEIICESRNEQDAVREEALRIGESFKAGLSYNGIVPRAKKAAGGERRVKPDNRPAAVLIDPLSDVVWDVMYYLGFRNQEQFLRLIDAFLSLTGMAEEALSLEVTGYPKFLFALRHNASMDFTVERASKFHDYILHFMEERDRIQMRGRLAARKVALEARRIAA